MKLDLQDFHYKYDRLSKSEVIEDALKDNTRNRKTRIIVTDHNTGEVLQDLENKITVSGSQFSACNEFGIPPTVILPSYNLELGLENSHPPYNQTQPMNPPVVCLWCAGRSGGLNDAGEILACKNTDRIEPIDDIVPFRYVSPTNDLSRELREHYYGRCPDPEDPENGFIKYYFKTPDTTPQLHVRYLDGTEVQDNMYNIDSSQAVEIYVESRLSATRLDFRDYYDRVLGWDNADISTISLLTGWYDDTIIENPDAEEEDQYYYRWFQDIMPYSKLNLKTIDLRDLNQAVDFNYQIFY